MYIKNLIKELEKYPQDMPVAINKCIDFTDMNEDNISINKCTFHCFPFTAADKFEYVNLEVKDEEYWRP